PELAAADTEAGTQCGKLGEVAVAAEGEELARDGKVAALDAAPRGDIAVEADERVLLQLVEALRQAVRRDVSTMGEEPDGDAADAPGDQRRLLRPRHAHGDVGVAPQQVGAAIAEHQLDRDARMTLAKTGEHRR